MPPETDTLDRNTDTQDQNTQDQNAQDQPWYNSLSDPDLRANPTLQKYSSQEEAHKGHLALQESFGKDKIVLPKDENDTAAWGKLNEFLGVPEKADGYGLEAMKAPEGAGTEMFDRDSFQKMMKDADIPKSKAEKLWGAYGNIANGAFDQAKAKFTQDTADTKTKLMGEYGEAYKAEMGRGDAVIDTFVKSESGRDSLTALAAQNPEIRMALNEIGKNFSETSIAGFQSKSSFTPTPAEATVEIGKIKAGAEYNSDDDRVRQPAIDRVLELRSLIKK